MAVEVTEGDGASKRQSVRIGDMNRVENIAYEGLGSLDISYDAMMAFEKPSNAVFQPLEYRSTNCCICIAVADHALSGATNVVDLGSGVVCYCLPGSDPPSVSISTAPAVWHIDTATRSTGKIPRRRRLWDEAFSRYNTGHSLYQRNGNRGVRSCSRNQAGCAYVAAIRSHMKNKPWE